MLWIFHTPLTERGHWQFHSTPKRRGASCGQKCPCLRTAAPCEGERVAQAQALQPRRLHQCAVSYHRPLEQPPRQQSCAQTDLRRATQCCQKHYCLRRSARARSGYCGKASTVPAKPDSDGFFERLKRLGKHPEHQRPKPERECRSRQSSACEGYRSGHCYQSRPAHHQHCPDERSIRMDRPRQQQLGDANACQCSEGRDSRRLLPHALDRTGQPRRRLAAACAHAQVSDRYGRSALGSSNFVPRARADRDGGPLSATESDARSNSITTPAHKHA